MRTEQTGQFHIDVEDIRSRVKSSKTSMGDVIDEIIDKHNKIADFVTVLYNYGIIEKYIDAKQEVNNHDEWI